MLLNYTICVYWKCTLLLFFPSDTTNVYDEGLDNGKMNSYGIQIFISDNCKKKIVKLIYTCLRIPNDGKLVGLQILKAQNFC
jgi:hypothetical protein